MVPAISLCFLVLALNADVFANPSATVADRYIAMAIRGDLRQAHSLFEGSERGRSAEFLELRERFGARFVDRAEPLSPGTGIELLDDIVSAYRDYWVDSLVGDRSQTEQDARLERALHEVLLTRNPDARANDVYNQLETSIERLGIGALAIPAPPLQDLFVWKRRRDENFTVALSDQTRAVRVAFLGEFVSLGWKNYAALGLATTTGWAEDGVLYCVEKSYLAGTERFQVSFLKHETRHLADLERFPDLGSADLEYRAKLTELAFASQTLSDLLSNFAAKSGPRSGSPHAEANFRVIRDLHSEVFGEPPTAGQPAWSAVGTRRINAAARDLLRRDSAAREALADVATP